MFAAAFAEGATETGKAILHIAPKGEAGNGACLSGRKENQGANESEVHSMLPSIRIPVSRAKAEAGHRQVVLREERLCRSCKRGSAAHVREAVPHVSERQYYCKRKRGGATRVREAVL